MFPNSLRLLLIPGVTLALSAPVSASRGVTPEDYFAFEFVSAPTLSPDGQQVAYVRTVINEQKNRRDSSIWLVATDGHRAPKRLTAEGFNSNSPRWNSDGSSLAFLSNRNSETSEGGPPGSAGRAQIWVLPMGGGEAQVVSHLKNGVESFQWSPEGKRLTAVSRTGPNDQIAPANRKSDVRHYKHISYKFNDTGWYDDKRSHLWVIDCASGRETQITSGDDWNDTDPQWSPNGTRIAFVSDRTGEEYDGGFNKDVWAVSAEGGPLTKISDHAFEDEQPRWSPDGKQLLFTGKTDRRQFPRLYLADAVGGSPSRLLVENLDLIPTGLQWCGQQEIRFAAGVKGQTQIFRVNVAKRQFRPITSGERDVHGFDFNSKTGAMTYLANSFRNMDDLYLSDGSGERQLTHLNDQLWRELELGHVERVPYKSTDGWAIEGFLVKPLGWQPGKKYPMILSIHGGPAGQYGVDWSQEFQVYAAKGWAIFFCNPRGSTGYGEKFERGIKNNWGGMDYQDIMAGVNAVLERNPWIDPDRLGVTGGSYGGFMTNWILGHTTRFRAAVTLRSISNFISDDGTRDGAYGHEEDFSGFLFDDFDQYWNASPLKYAKNVKAPTLILHSDNDYRVPLEQGEQWFRALRHYGVNAEFVIFPRENHNLTRTGEPKHLVESLKWQVYWFERFLNGDSNAKPPDAP